MNSRADLTVDLGVGGLVDDECDYCDQIAGEYIVSDGGNFGVNTCFWYYLAEAVCEYYYFGQKIFHFDIYAYILKFGAGYRWTVLARLLYSGAAGYIARYYSATMTSSDCWADADQDGKIELTRSSEERGNLGCLATSSLPSTIHLWQ